MTVAELIAILSKLPGDTDIDILADRYNGYSELESLRISVVLFENGVSLMPDVDVQYVSSEWKYEVLTADP